MNNISYIGNQTNSYPAQGYGRRNGACCSSQSWGGRSPNSQAQLTQQLLPLIMSLLQQLQSGNAMANTAPTPTATPLPFPSPVNTPVTSAGLTADQAETLSFMREEEKLARDVYTTLYDQWGIQAFSNIASSEQRHMDTMAEKLDSYNLVDPVTDDTVGVFTNPELASLYQDLVAKGSQSAQDALHVGAYIEELDILDLQKAIDESDQADLIVAYDNLMRGSRNHLRSFVGLIEGQGIAYDPQLMPQEEVAQIVSSANERGGQGRGGRGRWNG